MELKEAIELAEHHNRWRTERDCELSMLAPKNITEALIVLIAAAKKTLLESGKTD
jgi:hypothetical protein